MNLKSGDCVIHEGVPVRVTWLAYSDAQFDYWWVQTLFVEPVTKMLAFGQTTHYKPLHTKLAA